MKNLAGLRQVGEAELPTGFGEIPPLELQQANEHAQRPLVELMRDYLLSQKARAESSAREDATSATEPKQ